MTLQLLTGKLPYNNVQEPKEICRKIMNGDLDFSSKYLKNIKVYKNNRNLSNDCKDFLDNTLKLDYNLRYNVK